MAIIDDVVSEECWQRFLEHKLANKNISKAEEDDIRTFIREKRYLSYKDMLLNKSFPKGLAKKTVISKEGTNKKRTVYSYAGDEGIVLKFIAYMLNVYDGYLSDNVYSFRQGYGIADVIRKLRNNTEYAKKYCFKADISNYFNSINTDKLLLQLEFVRSDDIILYDCFNRILTQELVLEKGQPVREKHGAMAGIPVSPFFANVYLTPMDEYFKKAGISYFRYSDDIIIFADNEEELERYRVVFQEFLNEYDLQVNEDKVRIYKPEEGFEFLGFSYDEGVIDISYNTKRKLKAKIKRKAQALRRWQRKKGLEPKHAAKGFINSLNYKFFGNDDTDEFTWSRWFIPFLTTDRSLAEIDEYVQMYIRYIFTGRHYKGNYRITYEELKSLGYRTLVNEYWKRCKYE